MIKRLECESSTRATYKKTEKLVQLVEQSLYTRTVKCSNHLFLIVFFSLQIFQIIKNFYHIFIFYTYKNIGGYSLKVKQLFVAQYILVQSRVSSLIILRSFLQLLQLNWQSNILLIYVLGVQITLKAMDFYLIFFINYFYLT